MASLRSLGALTLDILLQAGKFEEGMDRTARITDKRFREMERKAKEFGKTLGLTIAAGAGVAAAGMAMYVKNSIAAEKVQAQLAARIKDTGGAAQRSIGQLNDMASKLMGLTVFDDEAIGDVQAMLLTFKQIQGVNFDAATAATLDLATAMGTDANAAALQLGKALNDPVRGVTALAKAGVQFSVDQKAMIKSLVDTGDIAGAQRVILKELEGQMGTAAEAARNTLGGALTGLKNTFDNLLEGDAGSGGLKATTDAVNQFSNSLSDPQIKQAIDTIAGSIAGLSAELITGIANMTNFIAKQREQAGLVSIGDSSSDGLNARLGELAKQRKQLLSWDTDILGFIPSADTEAFKKKEIDRITKEMKEVQKEITYRIKKEQFPVIIFDGSDYKRTGPKPEGGGTKPSGGSSSTAAKERLKQMEDEARALRAAAEAQREWHERVLDMSANLEGPAAQVLRQYDKSMAELNGQFQDGKVRLDDYAKAQELLAEIRDKDLKGIKEQKTPYEEVNEALKEQALLLGMSSEQQEVYNNLKAAGVKANSEFGQSIIKSTEDLQAMREHVGFMDDVRYEFEGFFADVLEGNKSIKDSFKDMLEDISSMISRRIAENWVDRLFGKPGTTGSGSVGGWISSLTGGMDGAGNNWGSIFDLLSGGGSNFWGFADGGFTGPGGKYQAKGLVHAGEFVINAESTKKLGLGFLNSLNGFAEGGLVSGKDYLMTGGQSGVVTPNRGREAPGVVNNNNFTLKAPTSLETQEQIAQRIHFQTNLAFRRNR